MNSFFIGMIVVLLMFSACLVVAYVVDSIKNPKNKNADNESVDTDDSSNKIYYITNIQNQKKKRKPKPKKEPDLALKGTILRPEQFHKIFIDNDSSDNFN